MKTNVGGWDRNTRWILGGGAVIASLVAPVRLPWRIGLLLFGASELMTAGTRYCPLNEALGINTAPEELGSDLRSTARSIASLVE